jgi:putative transposase
MYFVTICTWQKECLLSEVVGDAVALTDVGTVVEKALVELPERFPVRLEAFVLMPNHVHAVLFMAEQLESTVPLGQIVRAFKSKSAIASNRLLDRSDRPFWQRNYYERILRNDDELDKARRYIHLNPSRWDQDEEHPDNSTINPNAQ